MDKPLLNKFILGVFTGIVICATLTLILHPHMPYTQDMFSEGILSDLFLHKTLSNETYLASGTVQYIGAGKIVLKTDDNLLVADVDSKVPITADKPAFALNDLKKNQYIVCAIQKTATGFRVLAVQLLSGQKSSVYDNDSQV